MTAGQITASKATAAEALARGVAVAALKANSTITAATTVRGIPGAEATAEADATGTQEAKIGPEAGSADALAEAAAAIELIGLES